MKITLVKYLQTLPGYLSGADGVLDQVTLHAFGHDRYNVDFVPTKEQIIEALKYLDIDDANIDPLVQTMTCIFGGQSAEEERAERVYYNNIVRGLLIRLERDITIGGAQ